MNLKNSYFLLLFLFTTSALPAQTVIKGTVTNAKTGKPLPGTNVYLAKTTIGHSTNEWGRYRIETNVRGTFRLVFSFVGFKKKVVPVTLAPKTITIDAALELKTIQMEKLTVIGSIERWKERLAFFIEEFIGTTRFAEKTKILNPEVLRFEVNAEDQLIAKSVKPLHIVNRALGYKLYVELQQFKWNQNGERGLYKIYPKYELLKPSSADQLEEWQENRREMYLGSMRHFLKKLYHNDVGNRFSITPTGNLASLTETETTFKLLGRVPMKVARMLKGFKLYDPIVVIYGESNYMGVFGDSGAQIKSVMAANSGDLTFFVNKHGILLNPLSIITGGYWSIKRVANALPLDYQFEE